MSQAIDNFKLNIGSAKQLDVIYLYLEESQVKNLDLSEILRAEIVLAVSALDNFIGDILHTGLVDAFQNKNEINNKFFKSFQIDMQTLMSISKAHNPDEQATILGDYIRKVNSITTYQKPDKIGEALQRLGIKSPWIKIAEQLEVKDAEHAKSELKIIIENRNDIAHGADFNYRTQTKNERDRPTTIKAIDFLENLCEAIHQVVQSETDNNNQ